MKLRLIHDIFLEWKHTCMEMELLVNKDLFACIVLFYIHCYCFYSKEFSLIAPSCKLRDSKTIVLLNFFSDSVHWYFIFEKSDRVLLALSENIFKPFEMYALINESIERQVHPTPTTIILSAQINNRRNEAHHQLCRKSSDRVRIREGLRRL